VGVDISQFSLDRMSEIYAGRKISWVVEDASSLDSIADNSVDLVLATQVLEHLPNPEEALIAIVRVLQPGGRAMIGTESSAMPDFQIAAPRVVKWLMRLAFYLGAVNTIYGTTPLFYVHRQLHSFTDSTGKVRTVKVPHGRFHPRYFQAIIDEYNLPAKISFMRITGLDVDYLISHLGPRLLFAWLEFKAKIPVLKYLGDQVFLVIEKTESN
jgi:SAM-dependent methyltransferase